MKRLGNNKRKDLSRQKPIVNPRYFAVRSLCGIFGDLTTPKKSIEEVSATLEKRDRAFLMEIVYGVLRQRDLLDHILGHFLRRPSRLGDITLNNLRAAVYQIFFMRVPDFAVVDEAVNIEKSRGKPSLVNAVLRSLLRQREAFVLPIACDDPMEFLALNFSHPLWLVKRWNWRFGYEEAEELCRINNGVPSLTLRVNTLRTSRDDLIRALGEKGISSAPTPYSPDGLTIKDIHSPLEMPDFRGDFVVQDEASQLISYLISPQPGQRILDACAAPGGKTTHIAQLMGDHGEIVAVEQDERRIERLRENTESLGIRSVRIVRGDFSELNWLGFFDRVLLDAPCSALGVIRRNPDVRYRRRPKDLAEFHALQLRLLLKAADLLNEHGIVVYSVCSMEPEEGDEVLRDFLKRRDDFRIIDTGNGIFDGLKQDGIVRLYPQRHNMDGFFGVALCRKK